MNYDSREELKDSRHYQKIAPLFAEMANNWSERHKYESVVDFKFFRTPIAINRTRCMCGRKHPLAGCNCGVVRSFTCMHTALRGPPGIQKAVTTKGTPELIPNVSTGGSLKLEG
eukprot:Trichotokara_eunicae@DN4556_c0_g1_i9.p1